MTDQEEIRDYVSTLMDYVRDGLDLFAPEDRVPAMRALVLRIRQDIAAEVDSEELVHVDDYPAVEIDDDFEFRAEPSEASDE